MRRGILVGLVVGLMVLGFALVSFAQEGPVLDKVWAPAEVNIGSLLKIYVKAHDPNADMRWVLVSASRPEQMQPSGATEIRLKKGLGNELNGYLYFDSGQAVIKAATAIKVFIAIEDWKGNESETQSVVIKFVPKGAKVSQMPSDFKEMEIGPIIMPGTQRFQP
jgi:hypothetical protein